MKFSFHCVPKKILRGRFFFHPFSKEKSFLGLVTKSMPPEMCGEVERKRKARWNGAGKTRSNHFPNTFNRFSRSGWKKYKLYGWLILGPERGVERISFNPPPWKILESILENSVLNRIFQNWFSLKTNENPWLNEEGVILTHYINIYNVSMENVNPTKIWIIIKGN